MRDNWKSLKKDFNETFETMNSIYKGLVDETETWSYLNTKLKENIRRGEKYQKQFLDTYEELEKKYPNLNMVFTVIGSTPEKMTLKIRYSLDGKKYKTVSSKKNDFIKFTIGLLERLNQEN